MSVYSQEVEQPGYFKERRDAYKILISQVAGQLGAEDLQSICWYVDIPPKLRSCSALEVLEHLQKTGKFSERTVQFLSELLKNAGRVDLGDKVDDYTMQYVRHSSLPSSSAPPSSLQMPHSNSYSEGSSTHSSIPVPYQETRPLETSQVHPASEGEAVQEAPPSSVMNAHTLQRQFNPCPPNQSTSLEALPWGEIPRPYAPAVLSPGVDVVHPMRRNSWVDSRSLSNSGSLRLNYNSHPSSHNASQDAFSLHSEPMLIPVNDHPRFTEPTAHFRPGLQAPYAVHRSLLPLYGPSPPPHPPGPPVYSNWYQQAYTSASSIPEDDPSHLVVSHPPMIAPRAVHPQYQYRPHHNSASEISQLSSSQELQPPHYYRYSQHMGWYYTPPHRRRTHSFNRKSSPIRHQSISECPAGADIESSPERGVAPTAPATPSRGGNGTLKFGAEYATQNERPISSRNEWEESRKESVGASVGILNEKQLQLTKGDISNCKVKSEERLPLERNKTKAKPQAIMEEFMLNVANNEDVAEFPPVRRRTSSLKRDSEHSIRSAKATNRLSFQSVDERSQRRNSYGANENRSVCGLTNLAESRASHISSSRASAMHSNSTLNSEDTHFSPCSTLTKSRGNSSTCLKPHKRKETFLSRLTQQFSRVVRPHKEIEWPIKRSKLNKIIYEQTDKYLTCPYKMELDGGLGNSNPKLTLYVHPYGREEDTNNSVTLEVGIEISSRPKTQRLDSRAEVEVSVRAEDKEGKVEFGGRIVRESVRLNYFFIRGFISHQELKQSHSETVVIIMSANLISTV